MKQYLARACLALSLAFIGGCGGGGGGSEPTPVVTPFLVITTVNGLPVPALGIKYSITMESGDKIEVKASPNGAQWTVTADGNVIQADANQDGSSFSAVLNSPKGGQVVIKAVSSNDPSQEVEITAVVNAQKYERAAAQVGEVRTWTETDTHKDGSIVVVKNEVSTAAVHGDGSYDQSVRDITTSPGTVTETRLLDSEDNLLERTIANNNRCTYDPVRKLLKFPLYYGKSPWTSQWHYSCQQGFEETVDSITTVADYEPVTVGGTTHDALRLHTHVIVTQSNDPRLPLGSGGQAGYDQSIDCWWSVSLKRNVKCVTTTTYPSLLGQEAPGSYSHILVQELTGP
ncbi:hypothetical protein [Ideonella sp. BN130291]|uniref:hypothetical protein n=1 Tax=Ideonella sp. BN130291 TaxID=3112940 RepID=UPI002E267897|nr:hypothetical protein [Ideonella sp. BN130291]